MAVYRPSDGTWYVAGATPKVVSWGAADDLALPLPAAVHRRFFSSR